MMKRLYEYIMILAAAAMLSGCKEQLGDGQRDGGSTTGAAEGVDMVFSASFEGAAKTDLKQGGKVEWKTGDQIRIMGVDSNGDAFSIIAAADSDGANVDFPATLPVAEHYYAVYPASAAEGLQEDGTITVEVPSDDLDGRFSSANIAVACNGQGDASRHFIFRNAASILAFTLDEPAAEGVMLANVAEGAMGGTFKAYFDPQGNLCTEKLSQTPIISTLPLQAGTHYVAVLPGVFARGVAVRMDASAPAYFDDGNFTVDRAHIVNLGNLSAKTGSDIYVTENGAGSGSGLDWDNATTAAQIVRRMGYEKGSSDFDVKMKAWRSNGAVLHFAAGNHVFGSASNPDGLNLDFYHSQDGAVVLDERVKITMLGGYPAEGGDNRSPDRYESVLSGADLYRILQVRDMVDLSIDGLTFANAFAASNTNPTDANTMHERKDLGGSAIYISDFWKNTKDNQIKEAKTRPHVDITNCVFRNNSNTSSVRYDGDGRSCISLAKGRCHVNNCVFRDNSSKNYGIVSGSGGGGGQVENLTRGELFFNACLFENNRNTDSVNQGSVCYNNSKGTFVCFNNCTFRGNSNADKTDKAVLYCARNIMVANCTFVECMPYNANNAASATSADKTAIIRLNGDVLGCREYTLVNNLIIDDGENELPISLYFNNSSSGIITGNGGPERYAIFNDGGGNVMTKFFNLFAKATSGSTYGQYELGSNDFESTTVCRSEALGLQFDAETNVYRWSGELSGFKGVDETAVATAMNSNSDIGDLFYMWLTTELDAAGKDALGNVRSGMWTPGAYQAK